MAANYLVAAADGIYGRLARRSEPSEEDLQDAAWLACDALRTLAEDVQFRHDVSVLAFRRQTSQGDYDEITGATTGSVEHFEYFLTMERRLLLEAGMQEDLVTELLQDVLTNVEQLREGQRESSPEAMVSSVFASVGDLRDQTCTLAAAREQKARTLARLKIATHGVAGAAIIVINVGAVGVLSPAGTAVSGAIGATFIATAAKEIGIAP